MFIPYKIGHVGIIPWQELVLSAGSSADLVLDVGMALTASAVATGTTAPKFISMARLTIPRNESARVPVIPADADVIFETQLSEASASIAVGTKYTIDTTGGMITSTSTSGVAEVLGFDGTAKGSKVRVKF